MASISFQLHIATITLFKNVIKQQQEGAGAVVLEN